MATFAAIRCCGRSPSPSRRVRSSASSARTASGKSTLLKILAGVLRPDRGRVELDGALGYCPQEVVLNESLTVAQHLAYFAAAYGIHDLRRADELVNRLAYQQYRNTHCRHIERWHQAKAQPHARAHARSAYLAPR